MAWNSRNKSLDRGLVKGIPLGAPIATNPGLVSRPYHDGWDIERAYTQGVARVTWVFRCIDAIASNQAALPIILRKDNNRDGEIVSSKSPVTNLLNRTANEGESSFAFRYRVSSQLLMSTRGVFIEITRGRDGNPMSLHLLPPQDTSPIPSAKGFVSGYEVKLSDGSKRILSPDSVLWIRKPHPLDPYRSITPMEAAGLSIEIEALAKVYNRNFLVNDGRPGGLLVLRGEIDPSDKRELESRFRGNLNNTGKISVISSDDGADFVDTGSNPRDAAYIQMRQITKEEILAAFGVPESIIGNAANRTFSNASEEGKVFWMETMSPHLELLARAFDALDEERYVGFNIDQVPIMIIAKQERESYKLQEFNGGLISANEYREATGRKVVDSELSDALLANPNLTPIGNTKKKMETPGPQQQGPGGPLGAAGGGGANLPLPVLNGEVPLGGADGAAAQGAPQGGADQGGQGLFALAAAGGESPAGGGVAGAFPGVQGASETPAIEVKRFVFTDDWAERVGDDLERWNSIMDRTTERFFERQERVVLEKVGGKKAGKLLGEGGLAVDQIFDSDVWNRQMSEDFRPVFSAVLSDAANEVSVKADVPVDVNEEEIQAFLDAQTVRLQNVNSSIKGEIATAILVAMALSGEDDDVSVSQKVGFLKTAIKSIFVNALSQRRDSIVENEILTSYNAGLFFSGKQAGAASKTWLTRADSRVREAHRLLHGKSVKIGEGFEIDGVVLRFPKDPLAPPHLTMGCRCLMTFSDSGE